MDLKVCFKMTQLPKALRDLITAFERLPGIGPKSASRLGFYLLNTPERFNQELAGAVVNLKERIKICKQCFGVGEEELCAICSDRNRDEGLICVVERSIDVIAIEAVGGFKGVYHVLGGVVNPLERVGPEDLKINELILRINNLIKNKDQIEIILATNPTMEGEATALYIKNKLQGFESLKITRIGSGLPMGADMEYADQATLSRAMEGRKEI